MAKNSIYITFHSPDRLIVLRDDRIEKKIKYANKKFKMATIRVKIKHNLNTNGVRQILFGT